MTACSFLDSECSSHAFVVNGHVMEEVFVCFWEIFSHKRTPSFFASEAALYRCGEKTYGGLGAQHFEEVGVGDQGVLVQME